MDCTQRYPGCHAVCPNYKQQRAEYDETMDEMRKKREVKDSLNGFYFDNIQRTNRRINYRKKYRKGL
jgi:hypothetical protein